MFILIRFLFYQFDSRFFVLFCLALYWSTQNMLCLCQILTSKESQPLFDQTGQTVNSNSQSYTNTFTPFTFWHKDSTPITHLLNHKKYMNEVVPNSFKKPYLIKVTSEFCFTCLHLESIWKDVVQELESLGGCCNKHAYGIYIVIIFNRLSRD